MDNNNSNNVVSVEVEIFKGHPLMPQEVIGVYSHRPGFLPLIVLADNLDTQTEQKTLERLFGTHLFSQGVCRSQPFQVFVLQDGQVVKTNPAQQASIRAAS